MGDELKQLAFRVPASMLEQIDAYAAFMAEQSPGLAPSRSDAVRVLLAHALAAHEKAHGPKPKRK
jgi:hypothetical protein